MATKLVQILLLQVLAVSLLRVRSAHFLLWEVTFVNKVFSKLYEVHSVRGVGIFEGPAFFIIWDNSFRLKGIFLP